MLLSLYVYQIWEKRLPLAWFLSKKIAKKKLATTYFRFRLSSAYECLTSLFGMGRGVPTQLSSPIKDFVL